MLDRSLDARSIEHCLGHSLTEAERDLLDVTLEVLCIDRSATRSDIDWTRQLDGTVYVRNPARWQGAAGAALRDVLGWLTDDSWSLRFMPRARVDDETPIRLPGMREEAGAVAVALNSGGLDAYCGPLLHPPAPGSDLILVSGRTNPRMAHPQQHVAYVLGRHLEGVRRVSIEIPSSRSLVDDRERESSQRTRPLLYMVLGLVVASAHRHHQVRAYENVIGSLNLPLLRSQTSTHVSRAMHPRTLLLVSRLAQAALGRSVQVVNPAALLTKSEMCRRLPSALRSGIVGTTSCDVAFSNRKPGAPLCGTCASCLLRRQSLLAAGLEQLDRSGNYAFDLLAGVDLADPRARVFLAHRLHVRRLRRALSAPNAVFALLSEFPDLAWLLESPSADDPADAVSRAIDPYIRPLRTHVQEWLMFEQRVLNASQDPSIVDDDPFEQLDLRDAVAALPRGAA